MNVTGRKKRVLRGQILHALEDYLDRQPANARALALRYAERLAGTMTYKELEHWRYCLNLNQE